MSGDYIRGFTVVVKLTSKFLFFLKINVKLTLKIIFLTLLHDFFLKTCPKIEKLKINKQFCRLINDLTFFNDLTLKNVKFPPL
jgi:hypothetical protein